MNAKPLLITLVAVAMFAWGCSDDDPATPGGGNGETTKTEPDVTIPATADNTLYQDENGELSNGAGEHMFAGLTGQLDSLHTRRALVRFSVVDSIPSGARVDSVKLELNMSKTVTGSAAVSIHKVTTDWGEDDSQASFGEGIGAPADTGDATWLHGRYPADFWSTPGGDFAAGPSATASVGAPDQYLWGPTAQMAADVQDWLDNPANDFGWILVGDEATSSSAKRFATHENTDAGSRPRLHVYYTQ